MVPEWQEAYMNYNYLKTLLKEILIFRRRLTATNSATAKPRHSASLKRRVSLFRAFSGLTSRYGNTSPKKDKEDEVILVSAMQEPDEELGDQDSRSYQTIFLRSSEDGGEFELVFFKRLDHEFNKVNSFYREKVEEVVKQAEELNIQMDALIALRIKVNDPYAVSPFINQTNTGSYPLETIKESETSEEKQEKRSGDGKGYNMASLEVLNQVKINATTETPISTMKSVFHILKSDFRYNKNELKDAQGKLKQAFVEFHEKLRFLKNYAFLNQLAFSKIMKKYDKITSRNASDAYLQMVEESYLGQSDEVAKLLDRVEAAFVKHFCNGNRHQAMNTLRPKAKRERHRVTFFVGCFFGCSLALVVAIISVIHLRDILNSEGRNQYMNTIFPLYSLFGYLVLHLLMYAGNVYYWTRYRVNYSFIFGFKAGTELGFNEVLLVGSGLSVLTLAGILSNLEMQMDKNTQSYKALTELVPLGLVILVLLIAFCPFNIFYRANRYLLLVCLWHCVCAPFYTVTLPDFFLADQFTSQVQLLRSLQFYVCYYGWGDFKKRDSQTCNDSDIYKTITIIIAVIPYWIRVLQCLRRLLEGHDSTQALNALKYFSTIVAVVARTIHVQRPGNSENPWLRDKLILPNRSIYFIAMVLNVILRLAWMQTVLDFHDAPFLHRNALIAIVASLEIIRRGIWNFFRLENEHLNNVGKFRAVKNFFPKVTAVVEALVQKLIDEDNGCQNAILDLALQFETSCTAKDDLRKAYEKCNDISQESRALIDSFLKEGCSSSHADLYLTEKELYQLHLDEEALRKTLEEQAMDAKARKEKIRQKQADDDEFFLTFGRIDPNFTNENDPWEYSLDIDNFDLNLTHVLRSFSSARVEPSPYTPNPVRIIPGPVSTVLVSSSTCFEPSSSTSNPVRIIPGPAGLVQRAKQLKENVFILDPDGALMLTQEYMQKVVEDVGEDSDFNSGAWISATNYVFSTGGTSCSPNCLGDLNVTMKDLSGIGRGTVHHKVLDVGTYGKDIHVGAAMVLAKVSVFTPKPSKHYVNITKKNMVKVFCKDTVPTAKTTSVSPISSYPTIEESSYTTIEESVEEHEYLTEGGLTEDELHQLAKDEEALKEVLEEEAKREKENAIYNKKLEEYWKEEQAHDELMMKFWVKSDPEYETD
ncbi:SPX and EXS domain-containing protein [Tanacetum coccineum]